MRIGLCLITWNELEGCKHDVPLIDKSKFEKEDNIVKTVIVDRCYRF